MPRNHRSVESGIIYHVLNRGNGRMRLFHKDEDFAAFEKVLAQGLERYPVDLLRCRRAVRRAGVLVGKTD